MQARCGLGILPGIVCRCVSMETGFVKGWLPPLNFVKQFHRVLMGLATDILMVQSQRKGKDLV